MTQYHKELLVETLTQLGGTGTLAEICDKLQIDKPWDREVIFNLCQRHCERIPVSTLDRAYFAKNTGSAKWAYRIKTTRQLGER